jgi:hypothetical protein
MICEKSGSEVGMHFTVEPLLLPSVCSSMLFSNRIVGRVAHKPTPVFLIPQKYQLSLQMRIIEHAQQVVQLPPSPPQHHHWDEIKRSKSKQQQA